MKEQFRVYINTEYQRNYINSLMEEKIPFNEGLYKQLAKTPIFNYSREKEKLTVRDIVLAKFYIGFTHIIKYSEPVKTEEELDTALEHYFRVEAWKNIN